MQLGQPAISYDVSAANVTGLHEPALKAPAEVHAALIEAVARCRDRSAFVQIFEHFAPRVKAYLMRGGTSSQAAEELAQEVMLTVWRRAELFNRNQGHASTWIFTIARNTRIDKLRRENRPELDPDDPVLVPTPEASPEHAAATGQTRELIRKAVGTLPADQRAVLELFYFEQKTQHEISTELDWPLGTVKSRMRLAINRLQTMLRNV